jgi:hypothetical protein
MDPHHPARARRLLRISWRDLAVTLLPLALVLGFGMWALLRFVRPAPPHTLVTGTDAR